jgi:hypothetical protein
MKRTEEHPSAVVPEQDGGDDLTTKTPRRPRWRQPQRHQWFDAWKTAKGDGPRRLVDATAAFLAHHEEHTKARARARRPDDQANHLKRIEAVVCNLAHAVLLPPPTGRIAIQLGNRLKGRSRYDSPAMGKTLSPLVMMLQELDFLDLNWSTTRGEVSSIAPSPWFARKVAEFGVTLADFGRDEAEEVLLLTCNTREVAPWSRGGARTLHREPIDYADTAETRRHRAAVRHLNAFLRAADVAFLDDGLEPRVDPFERTLRRRFVVLPEQDARWGQGGRLFGGFWQTLKSDRRRHVRIDGEPVADLDYSSMFTRLAYAAVGAVPPEGDLYDIRGLEGYRSGVKMAMNSFLFDRGGRRSTWPKELGVGIGSDDDADADPASPAADYKARLPAGWGVGRTKKAILAKHPALRDAWGRQFGYTLMFRESEVLLAVLEDLADNGVAALPLHDGLMVAASQAKRAEEVMDRWARELTGLTIPVTVSMLASAPTSHQLLGGDTSPGSHLY